jgi:hypothetical protein
MKRTYILAFALATVTAWTVQASQEKLAASINETRLETIRTRDQLQQTVHALKDLTTQKKGDLRETYNTFAAEVKNTQAAAAWTAARAQSMESAGKQYFGDWQASLIGVSNNSVRKKGLKRLEETRKDYDKVVESLKEAAQKFKPFLSNLDDVQKAMAQDVTPAGVKSIRGIASDAESNVKKVSRSINSAVEELDRMEKALSSESKG